MARNQFDCQDLGGGAVGESADGGEFLHRRLLGRAYVAPQGSERRHIADYERAEPADAGPVGGLGTRDGAGGITPRPMVWCAFLGICRACVCALEGSFLTHPFRMRILLFVTGHGVGCDCDFVTSPCLVGGGNGRDG